MQFSWTHSFPASCISDMNSIVCGMERDFSYFWIKSNAPTYSSSHWAWRLSKRGQTTQIPEKNEQLLCSVKSLGELLRIEKANYLSFESWGWHGAHIFASTGLASWMNSEFPRENIFRTENQSSSVLFVVFLLCIFALCLCFLFVICVFALYFFVLRFCVCTYYLHYVFSWCLCIVFVFSILIGVPACLCFVIVICVVYLYIVFVLFVCVCLCFVLVCALCLQFVFALCL